MPQFDQFSFLNQVFWILVVFSNFYFFVSYFLLPKISKIIKYRLKKVKFDEIINNNLSLEKFQLLEQLNTTYNKIFQVFELNFIEKKEKYLIKFKLYNKDILNKLSFIKNIHKFNTTTALFFNNFKNV